jgi:HEAT repeat protein
LPQRPPTKPEVYQFGRVGERVVSALKAAFDSAPEWVKAEVLRTIVRRPWDPSKIPLLLDATRDENGKVRLVAAEVLRKVGAPEKGRARSSDPRIASSFTEALNDEDPEVRVEALHALNCLGQTEWRSALMDLLKHEEPSVRVRTAWALGEMKDFNAVPDLIAALKDESNSVRRAAAYELGAIGDLRAIEPLIDAL